MSDASDWFASAFETGGSHTTEAIRCVASELNAFRRCLPHDKPLFYRSVARRIGVAPDALERWVAATPRLARKVQSLIDETNGVRDAEPARRRPASGPLTDGDILARVLGMCESGRKFLPLHEVVERLQAWRPIRDPMVRVRRLFARCTVKLPADRRISALSVELVKRMARADATEQALELARQIRRGAPLARAEQSQARKFIGELLKLKCDDQSHRAHAALVQTAIAALFTFLAALPSTSDVAAREYDSVEQWRLAQTETAWRDAGLAEQEAVNPGRIGAAKPETLEMTKALNAANAEGSLIEQKSK